MRQTSWSRRLREREYAHGRPVRIGLAGAGQMGTGFVAQVRRMTGMQIAAVADVVPGRAAAALRTVGAGAAGATPTTDVPVVEGDDPDRLAEAIWDRQAVAVPDAGLLAALPLDAVVDATGVPEVGAALAIASLLAGKDVAVLNVETDVTVGLLLAQVARATGRVYTVCRGDEPAEAKLLVDFARDLAFEVVCAGKGKNNPHHPHATPESVAAEAASKGMNPKMLASFVDGSKTMIEMAALANATGLEVSRRGMTGPATTVDQLAQVFRPAADGGVLDRAGVVDYATGPVAPGVFVVARSNEPVVIEEMAYLSMGPGPYFSFYRPYHLASIEAPLSVAEAVLDRAPSLVPECWMAEVIALAKRPLKAGERLGGIGGDHYYGVVDSAAVAKAEGLVPIGVVAGATVTRNVPVDQPLTWDDVELDPDSVIVSLRRLQDRLFDAPQAHAQARNGIDPALPQALSAATTHIR